MLILFPVNRFHILELVTDCARRYLRARKFSPQEAFKQFKDTEDWRKENNLEELYDTIDISEYDETRRLASFGSASK